MNKSEIKDFKKFLREKNIYLMFSQNYHKFHLSVNPALMETYFENARVENVIPQAFVYPKSIYDRDFWLAIHEEWLKRIEEKRAKQAEGTQLEALNLEIIELSAKSTCIGLPSGICSLSLKGGNRLTFNMETSKKVAMKLSTHMMLTRSRNTTDVVLMFNRQKGLPVKFKDNSLQFNNAELARHLIELLDLDPEIEYYQLKIEKLAETKDYLLFTIKKID